MRVFVVFVFSMTDFMNPEHERQLSLKRENPVRVCWRFEIPNTKAPFQNVTKQLTYMYDTTRDSPHDVAEEIINELMTKFKCFKQEHRSAAYSSFKAAINRALDAARLQGPSTGAEYYSITWPEIDAWKEAILKLCPDEETKNDVEFMLFVLFPPGEAGIAELTPGVQRRITEYLFETYIDLFFKREFECCVKNKTTLYFASMVLGLFPELLGKSADLPQLMLELRETKVETLRSTLYGYLKWVAAVQKLKT